MFLNDQETSTDLLHYEAIARTVERFINETPEAPVTIGVHGDCESHRVWWRLVC